MNKVTAGKFLSQALRDLSQENHDTDGDRDKTRAECLARYVWDAALGHERSEVDKATNTIIQKYCPPQTWAIHLLFERLEGKVPFSEDIDDNKPILSERVKDVRAEDISNV